MLNTKAPQPLDGQIGARMRLRRISMKMNQEDLADALGVTFQQVQKYENGKNRVSASRLQSIANALGVPISYFFDGAGSGKASGGNASAHQDAIKLLQTRDAVRMVRAYAAITDQKLRAGILLLAESRAATGDAANVKTIPSKVTKRAGPATKHDRRLRSVR